MEKRKKDPQSTHAVLLSHFHRNHLLPSRRADHQKRGFVSSVATQLLSIAITDMLSG
jgi:hypothetical protein